MADRYDEHGRPIIHTAATGESGSYMYGSDAPVSGVPHGTTGGAPVGAGVQHGAGKEQHEVSGILHRSTSSSSSSSEDDGMGGRRKKKKGLKEKIKEKLPAGHKEKQHAEAGGQPGHPQEKKGVIEKIKEKLPGHN